MNFVCGLPQHGSDNGEIRCKYGPQPFSIDFWVAIRMASQKMTQVSGKNHGADGIRARANIQVQLSTRCGETKAGIEEDLDRRTACIFNSRLLGRRQAEQ